MISLVWTIVVAGGSGSRFGAMKQFEDLNGRTVVAHSVETARAVSEGVVLVAPRGFSDDHGADLVVEGGDSRSASVRAGLSAVPQSAEIVLVHDAARPLGSVELFRRVVEAVSANQSAVVPTVPLVDSIRKKGGPAVDRDDYEAVQTPQGFPYKALVGAHDSDLEASDDATLVELLGLSVDTVSGEPHNFKITTPNDLALARLIVGGDLADQPKD